MQATKFNLLRLRTDLGMKQSQIAEVLEIPQSSISAMENGKTNVSQAYVNTLVQKLSIPNIQEYYEEIEIGNISNNSGNGIGNNNNIKPAGSDPLVLARITSMEKDLGNISGNLENRIAKLEDKVDRYEEENRKLHQLLTEFKILCIKNGVDYEMITG